MTRNDRLKVLGLTGGIAAGKSTVASFLRGKKGYVLDADRISRRVMAIGEPGYYEILEAISGDYLQENGEIDRGKLGEIVFGNRSELEKLEKIVHRRVLSEIEAGIEKIRENPAGHKFIVIDAPLLIESGADKLCDAVMIIMADYERRLERLMSRNCLTKEQAMNRINIQTDWDNLQNNEYIFVYNNGSIEKMFIEISESLKGFIAEEASNSGAGEQYEG